MPSFDPKLLAAWTDGRWTKQPAVAPAGFGIDSRHLLPGFAFVALRTDRRDGHDFLAAAQASGAAAAIVSRHVPEITLPQLVVAEPLVALQTIARKHRRRFTGPVFAVTGSAGKTSTKEILAMLLGGPAAGVLATEGNLNNHIGVALTLTRLDLVKDRYAVIEAGISAPGEMDVLAAMIEPDTAIVTFVGPAHLEELGGLEGVAREKAALARHLRPGGVAVFPSSCVAYEAFRELDPARCLVLERAERLVDVATSETRLAFAVSHTADITTVSVGLAKPAAVVPLRRTTDGMAQNVALAVCAALRAGIRWQDVQQRLSTWQPAPLRGEWTENEGRRVYLDCYNANPASMTDALEYFDSIAPEERPRYYVIGCMEELGAGADHYHVELGRSLHLRRQDRLLVVGGSAGAVRAGAIEAGSLPEQIDTGAAIDEFVPRLAAFQGTLFVKGSRRHALERAFLVPALAGAVHA